MKTLAILNRDGGTLKTTDLGAFADHLRGEFRDAGHDLVVDVVDGAAIVDTLRRAAADPEVETIVAGGGDGTVSAAAAAAWKNKKAVGVLPAGTMNLFARALAIPLDIHLAARALANADVADCDIATANGRPFVHQYSVGLQPKVVADRDSEHHRSRLHKMLNGVKSALGVFMRPPSFPVRIVIDGETREERLSLLAVSNNPYGEGHIPYADGLDDGLLGVYRAGVLGTHENLKLAADLAAGNWRANADFRADTAREVTIVFQKRKHDAKALIDGELIPLEPEVHVRLHRRELRVLKPRSTGR